MNIRETIESYRQVFIICDRNVEAFAHALGDYPTLTVHASEATKTAETAVGICRWLMEHGADRDALVVAIGGGVTTDLAGFAASIYKRGIAYANVPTTLLAMVDAGIGGKTGVNLDGSKNMIGTFRMPEYTWLFPDLLRSLPRREFLSGAAEMLKTFIIEDRDGGYARTVKMLKAYAESGVSPAATADGIKELSALITAASGVKQDIVSRDPLERGERRVLNLGHTWGHAIEWWQVAGLQPATDLTGGSSPCNVPPEPAGSLSCKLPLSHGEAVAIGIICAARKAEELGIAGKSDGPLLSEKLAEDFAACGLPTELPCSEEALEPAMKRDKKAAGEGRIRYVLPVRIGKVVVRTL